MAIFHLDAKTIGRSAGRSATAAAAYRSGEKIEDERTGETHDYTRRTGVEHSEIVLPKDALESLQNRSALWNAAEGAENRKNSCVAREVVIALPNELNEEQRKELTREFAEYLADRHKVGVDIAIHEPARRGDERNYHAHLLLTTRELGAEGFGAKTRELDVKQTSREHIAGWRKEWEREVNQALERVGIEARVDCRSHAEKGEEREPKLHMGVDATAIERRGEASRIGEENRKREARNQERGTGKEPKQQKRTPDDKAKDAQDMKEVLTELWQQGWSGKEFMEAAAVKGYMVASGEKRPYVVVDEEGKVHNLARLMEGLKTAELRVRLGGVELPTVQEATKRQIEQLGGQQKEVETKRQLETWRLTAQRTAEPAFIKNTRPQTGVSIPRVGEVLGKGAGIGVRIASGAVESLADAVCGLLEGLMVVSLQPKFTMREYARNPQLREEERLAMERRGEALDRMNKDIKAQQDLKLNDLQALTRKDLENIKAKGEEHLITIICEREVATRQRSLDYDGGRERDR